MTEQENVAIMQLRTDFLEHARKLDRIERALLGDAPYGDMGLIIEHSALLARVADLETVVKDLRATNGVITRLVQKGPVWVVGAMAFIAASGGDLGAIWQFVAGIIK